MYISRFPFIKDIATTVFTPLELGTVGLSEDEAIKQYGAESIDVYASEFEPLEWNLQHKEDITCYSKIVVNKLDNGKGKDYNDDYDGFYRNF
jgi:thioredoxin reductase (NADPH)